LKACGSWFYSFTLFAWRLTPYVIYKEVRPGSFSTLFPKKKEEIEKPRVYGPKSDVLAFI
jgi:hypothetical protein